MRDAANQASDDDDHVRAAPPHTSLAIIWPLLGRHIAFHRRLVDLTASVKAALLLSQAIYWTRHGRDLADRGGWFFKTAEQWSWETGLSAKEQATARDILRELAILHEQRIGIPAKLHFRVGIEQLGALLAERIGRLSGGIDGDVGTALAELLGPSIAYHRILAEITGGVHAGLLLSRALHLTRLQMKRQMDAWIGHSAARWTDDTGLTRREQEGARRVLMQIGVWEELLAGMPPRRLARPRLDGLLALLVASRSGANARVAPMRLAESEVSADRAAPNGETGLWSSHTLVLPKAPKLFYPNRHHSFAENANPYIERSTQDLLQPPQAIQAVRNDGASVSGGGDLVFPDILLAEERIAARRLVLRCPDHAQELLDELAARLQANAVQTTPLAYLRGIVKRALAGDFIPEAGLRITLARREQAQALIHRQQREADAQRLAAAAPMSATPARRAARRAQLQQLRDALRIRPQAVKQS
jgi:hypothetical protein